MPNASTQAAVHVAGALRFAWSESSLRRPQNDHPLPPNLVAPSRPAHQPNNEALPLVESRAFGRDTSDPFIPVDTDLPCPPFFRLDDGTVIELRTADDYRTHFGHEPNAGTLRAYEALEERDTWPSAEPANDYDGLLCMSSPPNFQGDDGEIVKCWTVEEYRARFGCEPDARLARKFKRLFDETFGEPHPRLKPELPELPFDELPDVAEEPKDTFAQTAAKVNDALNRIGTGRVERTALRTEGPRSYSVVVSCAECYVGDRVAGSTLCRTCWREPPKGAA
jgi:hypothetical protein